jgi:hypothetical protein
MCENCGTQPGLIDWNYVDELESAKAYMLDHGAAWNPAECVRELLEAYCQLALGLNLPWPSIERIQRLLDRH